MVENKVAQAIKTSLVENGYEVVYSENSGRIFGMDILQTTFTNGNSVRAIIRNHMVSIDVLAPSHETINKTSFEMIDEHEEFIEQIIAYFATIKVIFGAVR